MPPLLIQCLQGKTYDLNLFTPALLCSKAVIYNRTGGLLTDDIRKDLGMMTQAGQRLRAGQSSHANDLSDGPLNGRQNGVADVANLKPLFGHLFILFNRFQLNPDSKSERANRVAVKHWLINLQLKRCARTFSIKSRETLRLQQNVTTFESFSRHLS
jgi:hypothetical protein